MQLTTLRAAADRPKTLGRPPLMISHVGNVAVILLMLALAVALCVFGLWACSVVVRRMHLPGLLIVQAVALLLSFGVLSAIGPGGELDPGEMHGVVWFAVIINGIGIALWFAFPRPTRKDDAQDESLH